MIFSNEVSATSACVLAKRKFLSEEENITRFRLSDWQLNELTDRLGQYIAHPTRNEQVRLQIDNKDKLCLPRAIVVRRAYIQHFEERLSLNMNTDVL